MKKRNDRLNNFLNNYNFNIKCNKFDAIDGKTLDINLLFKNGIIGEYGYKSLNNFRKYHHELTNEGSIGCYLSHYELWLLCLNKSVNNEYYLIFEDDTILNNNIKLVDIENRINELPSNWDIYLLSNPNYVYLKEYYSKNIYKVKRFYLTNAYVINKNGINKILNTNTIFPINQQIDSYLSELTFNHNLNIYIHNNKYLYFNQSQEFKTDIQETSIFNLSNDRYIL